MVENKKENKELVKETITRTYRITDPDGHIRYETSSNTMEIDDEDDAGKGEIGFLPHKK